MFQITKLFFKNTICIITFYFVIPIGKVMTLSSIISKGKSNFYKNCSPGKLNSFIFIGLSRCKLFFHSKITQFFLENN